jgi:predicted DNA-binding protein YlxM (UPF0122 family)
MTDTFWQSLFIFLGAAVVAGIQAWTSTRTNNSVRAASKLAEKGRSEIADKTEVVRTTLADSTERSEKKLDSIGTVLDATHGLVNSNYGVQLKLVMLALKRLSLITQLPEDIEAAAVAERAYQEHEAKQAAVDAKTAKVS